MKTYRDLCDEVQETKFGEYNQHHPSNGGKIRRVSHVKSLRRNQFCQLFNKASKPEIKLIEAVNDGCYDKVMALIGDGADVRFADSKGRTPLHFAVTAGYTNIVKLLIANGAAVNAIDSIGNTPLHLAACTNQVGIVTALLSSGADVSCADGFGQTPLLLANSRLRTLQINSSIKAIPDRLKKEVTQVIEMLKVYFDRARCEKSTADELESLASQLSISESIEEVDEVHGMLQHFTSMSLKKKTPSAGSSNISIAEISSLDIKDKLL